MSEPVECTSLADRVAQFRCLELPGQPLSMHMGTAYLVADLWREIERQTNNAAILAQQVADLTAERDAAETRSATMSGHIRRIEAELQREHEDHKQSTDDAAMYMREAERLRADSERIEYLESLMLRQQFQNQRRPTESVGSDMHMGGGRCSLYVRDLLGNTIEAECGYGESVRAAIDAARGKP